MVNVTDAAGTRKGVATGICPDGLVWVTWQDFTGAGIPVKTVELVSIADIRLV